MKIQEELEGPYQNRIDGLQDELERQQQRTFEIRREYEIIKTEYEQFAIDQVPTTPLVGALSRPLTQMCRTAVGK